MIVVVDDRHGVAEAVADQLTKERQAGAGMGGAEYRDWLSAAQEADCEAVDAVLLGPSAETFALVRLTKARLPRVALIVLNESHNLDGTLTLFAAGADDVVRMPVHIKEIVARIGAVQRRARLAGVVRAIDHAHALDLPRRESQILLHLEHKAGVYVTKTQIFNAVYGLFNGDFDESVIETHICRLRRKLKAAYGYDPIDGRRFIGYRLAYRQSLSADGDRKAQTNAPNGVRQPAC